MYDVLIERGAERDLKRLPAGIEERIVDVLKRLKDDPYPVGSRKIVGSKNDWRVRIGDYRAIYEVDRNNRTVKLMRIRHRREVYR